MVEQQARVITVEGDQLILETETQSSCNACEVKTGCGTSVLSKWVGKKFSRFQAANTVDAEVGDQVVVGLSETALLRGSLTIYLLPLLGMIIVALSVDAIMSQDISARDLIITLSAFAGFAATLVLCRAYLANEQLKKSLTPVVLRKVVKP